MPACIHPDGLPFRSLWDQIADRHFTHAAAGLLLDLFERWERTDFAAEDPLHDELRAIARDDEGRILADWAELFRADREAFADIAEQWVSESRELVF